MNNILNYFNGTNGTPVDGTVSVPFLVSYKGSAKPVDSMPMYYSDAFFSSSSGSYNHKLAIMSLGMTMAAFTYKSDGDRYIRELFHSIGCDDRTVETVKFGRNKPTDDSCGYAFAAKRLPDGSYLIPVVIRSHHYGGEWVSNAHVVAEAYPLYSAGFKAAADGVFNALTKYISARGLAAEKLKIWVTGFSRGGAVSNLLGAKLNASDFISRDNVFVYTFASPRTVSDEAVPFAGNIFNIVSEMDIVPRVPLRSWGYVRCGTDLILPCKARRGEEFYGPALTAVQSEFGRIMDGIGLEGIEYLPYADQELALDLLIDYLDDLLTTPEKYAEGGYQAIIMEYMGRVMTGDSLDLRQFVEFLLDTDPDASHAFCELFESWDSLKAMEKARRISQLPKYILGEKTPAREIISIILNILVRYARKLTATKVTGGTQDYYYEQLTRLIIDAYHEGRNSAVLMQHWPEVYLAWLRSADESTLFRTSSYEHASVK